MNKKLFIGLCVLGLMSSCSKKAEEAPASAEPQEMSVMEALAQRHSIRSYTTQELSQDQMMELLWAANGVSREDGKRTAPSAVNAQDIDLYVCSKAGVQRYDAQGKSLVPVTEQDIRPFFEAQNKFVEVCPFCVLLISDQTKFDHPRPGNRNLLFGMMDAGIVSENISLYCTAKGLATVCCAPPMLADSIQTALHLTSEQVPVLYHPVGYEE